MSYRRNGRCWIVAGFAISRYSSGFDKGLTALTRRVIGFCARGPACPSVHDHDKVAICKDYLQTGTCPAGTSCDLSHEPKPERVPACLHFLRGRCSNDQCRYAHVRVNPGAPVCRPFATLGYCEEGARCGHRHIFECPDYANTGVCNHKKCRLPHVDRAGQLRKMMAGDAPSDESRPLGINPDMDDNDVSSGEEADSDDFDSDGLAEEFMGSSGESNFGIFGQQDYIQF